MSLSATSLKFLSNLTELFGETESDGAWQPSEGRTFLIGNGGSSAVASHIANDMTKKGLRAHTLTDHAVMSCMANDYTWDRVYVNQLSLLADEHDVLVAISSSGQSANVLNAAQYAKELGMGIVTLSGFEPDNPLRKLGHVNYWVPSHNYGLVEIAHLSILHSIVNP